MVYEKYYKCRDSNLVLCRMQMNEFVYLLHIWKEAPVYMFLFRVPYYVILERINMDQYENSESNSKKQN